MTFAPSKPSLPRRASIRDVAKAAGVSVQTVSNVVNGRLVVSEPTRLKVLEACKALNYRQNAVARALVRSKSDQIGLVVPSLTNPKYGEIVETISRTASQHGLTVLVGVSERSAEIEHHVVDGMLAHQVAGIILIPLDGARSAQAADAAGIPLVHVVTGPGTGIDYFGIDNFGGCYAATSHLLSLGHRRLGFVDGLPISFGIERRAGFMAAVAAAGLGEDDVVVARGQFTREGGAEATRAILTGKRRPTAIVSASDLMAFGVLDAVDDLGLAVPDDLALVGFDDLSVASLPAIGLTTIAYDVPLLADRAIARLLQRINNEGQGQPEHEIVPYRLIIRKSCGTGRTGAPRT